MDDHCEQWSFRLPDSMASQRLDWENVVAQNQFGTTFEICPYEWANASFSAFSARLLLCWLPLRFYYLNFTTLVNQCNAYTFGVQLLLFKSLSD